MLTSNRNAHKTLKPTYMTIIKLTLNSTIQTRNFSHK